MPSLRLPLWQPEVWQPERIDRCVQVVRCHLYASRFGNLKSGKLTTCHLFPQTKNASEALAWLAWGWRLDVGRRLSLGGAIGSEYLQQLVALRVAERGPQPQDFGPCPTPCPTLAGNSVFFLF